MESEKQEKVSKFYGVGRMIARKTGFSEEHISGVLSGKRSRNGKKGRKIIELAMQITQNLEKINLDDTHTEH